MTTIAYRDGVIAADTGITSNGVRVAHTTKIARNKKGDLCGASGVSTLAAAFRKWFLGGEKGRWPSAPDESPNIIFRADGTVWIFDHNGSTEVRGMPYHAIGSGREFALGAMHAGATAAQAVEAAITFESGTFGDVEVLTSSPLARWQDR